MSAFTAVNVSDVNAGGPLAFEASGYVATLQAAMAPTDAAKANEAMEAFATLCAGSAEWVEPYLLSLLPAILDNFASPKTAEAAANAGNAIVRKMNAHSLKLVLDLLYESFSSMKWQTKKVFQGQQDTLSIYYSSENSNSNRMLSSLPNPALPCPAPEFALAIRSLLQSSVGYFIYLAHSCLFFVLPFPFLTLHSNSRAPLCCSVSSPLITPWWCSATCPR